MDHPFSCNQATRTAEEAAASERVDTFVRLLGQNQRRLYTYVISLVPNRTDAEDILQEVNLILWREFDRFQPGTNFTAWACRVALNQVLAWRKRLQRDRLEFSEAFLTAVAEELSEEAERLQRRSRLLANCMDRLPAHHRKLVRLRYMEGWRVEAIAEQLGRTAEAVYRMLSRIRMALHDCVSRSLAQEDDAT